MKVVLAPDKFSGTLSAAETARTLAEGWRRARPDDEVVAVPMADGGEGTLDVVAAAVPQARWFEVEVADPLGIATHAQWLLLPDGTALVESARACGLGLLPPERRDPLRATTYGVGQLIAAAERAGARRILVGLGGSATVDGGAGMAIALGHRLLRADGNGVKVGALWLRDLERIQPRGPLSVPVYGLADVDSPLLGERGAVAVFAPQKGARREDLPVLERALERIADVAERDLDGGPWRDLPGAGAAGGLGFGLTAFCGAALESGAERVAQLVGLEAALADADAVVTGEGALDGQTSAGKVAAHVLAVARARGIPALAVAGRIEDGAGAAFDATAELGPEGRERAAELVAERARELAEGL